MICVLPGPLFPLLNFQETNSRVVSLSICFIWREHSARLSASEYKIRKINMTSEKEPTKQTDFYLMKPNPHSTYPNSVFYTNRVNLPRIYRVNLSRIFFTCFLLLLRHLIVFNHCIIRLHRENTLRETSEKCFRSHQKQSMTKKPKPNISAELYHLFKLTSH